MIPIALLGVPIDDVSPEIAVERVMQLVDKNRRAQHCAFIATVNIDFYVQIYKGNEVRAPKLLEVLRRAPLVTADGMPLIWLSQMMGCPLRERVSGASLAPLIAQECAQKGLSLFLLGGEDSVTRRAATRLQQLSPALQIVGIMTPFINVAEPPSLDELARDEIILQELERANPDILYLGLGCPKEQLWYHRVRDRLRVPVCIGLGGTFKFLAGTVSRAPLWMQKSGLEWIYRWMQEPRALTKRYLHDLVEFPKMIGRILPDFFCCYPQGGTAHVSSSNCIQLPEHISATTIPSLIESHSRTNFHECVQFDFTKTRTIDAYGLGFFLTLYRERKSQSFVFIGLSQSLRDFFRRHRVWDLFKES